jgi:PPOX class probable F420-dependent enzyme
MASLNDPAVRALLEPVHYATLSTLNEDGSITSSIVWFNVEDGQVAINGATGRRWTENVLRDGRMALLVSAPENPYEYAEIRGVATAADDGDGHIDRLAKRYLGQDEYPYRQPGETRVRFLVEPTVIRHQRQ